MDIPGVDIPSQQIVLILVFLASNAATEILKRLELAWDPVLVNGVVSVAIGTGVGLIADGEPLPRVLVAAGAAVVSGLSASALHRVGHIVRAGVTVVEGLAGRAATPGPLHEEAEECGAP